MSDSSASSSSTAGALEFAEHAGRQRAAQYREQAAYFRSLAETEPLASLRRHLIALSRQYEELAAGAEGCNPGSSAAASTGSSIFRNRWGSGWHRAAPSGRIR
jgi:hypothetical protein